MKNCSNSIANALELLQSCTKTSIYYCNMIGHVTKRSHVFIRMAIRYCFLEFYICSSLYCRYIINSWWIHIMYHSMSFSLTSLALGLSCKHHFYCIVFIVLIDSNTFLSWVDLYPCYQEIMAQWHRNYSRADNGIVMHCFVAIVVDIPLTVLLGYVMAMYCA